MVRVYWASRVGEDCKWVRVHTQFATFTVTDGVVYVGSNSITIHKGETARLIPYSQVRIAVFGKKPSEEGGDTLVIPETQAERDYNIAAAYLEFETDDPLQVASALDEQAASELLATIDNTQED